MSSVCRGLGRLGLPRTVVALLLGLIFASGGALLAPAARASVPTPEEDPFYEYEGNKPLAEIAPGTVLKTRMLAYHVVGIPLPVKAVQLLYRSTRRDRPADRERHLGARAAAHDFGTPKVVAYQSFYDSLNPDDEPSYAISGGLDARRPHPERRVGC